MRVGLGLEIVIQERDVGIKTHFFGRKASRPLQWKIAGEIVLVVLIWRGEFLSLEVGLEHGAAFQRAERTRQVDPRGSENLANRTEPVMLRHLLHVDALLVHGDVAERANDDKIMLLVVA